MALILASLAGTFRFVPLAVAAVVVLVVVLVYWWRKPKLPRGALSIAKVKREVAPKRANQTFLDSILGIDVRAGPRDALKKCEATLIQIDRDPPDPKGPRAPIRLTWTPSGKTRADISPGGRNSIQIVRFLVDKDCELHSPDQHFPYLLGAGSWTFQLQLTVRGYSVVHLSGSFTVGEKGSGDWKSLERGSE